MGKINALEASVAPAAAIGPDGCQRSLCVSPCPLSRRPLACSALLPRRAGLGPSALGAGRLHRPGRSLSPRLPCPPHLQHLHSLALQLAPGFTPDHPSRELAPPGHTSHPSPGQRLCTLPPLTPHCQLHRGPRAWPAPALFCSVSARTAACQVGPCPTAAPPPHPSPDMPSTGSSQPSCHPRVSGPLLHFPHKRAVLGLQGLAEGQAFALWVTGATQGVKQGDWSHRFLGARHSGCEEREGAAEGGLAGAVGSPQAFAPMFPPGRPSCPTPTVSPGCGSRISLSHLSHLLLSPKDVKNLRLQPSAQTAPALCPGLARGPPWKQHGLPQEEGTRRGSPSQQHREPSALS